MPLYSLPSNGAFTPTMRFTNTDDAVFTYSIRTGVYREVDGLVWIVAIVLFDINAYTTASGPIILGGLPFPINIPSNIQPFTVGRHHNVTLPAGYNWFQGAGAVNSTDITFIGMGSNNVATTLGVSAFPASKTGVRIELSGVYRK